MSEQDLYALLHEWGHGQRLGLLSEFSEIACLTREQLAALRNSMDNIPYSRFNKQQREFAAYVLRIEELANANVRRLLEDEEIRPILFPGGDGLERVERYILDQITPIQSRFQRKDN